MSVSPESWTSLCRFECQPQAVIVIVIVMMKIEPPRPIDMQTIVEHPFPHLTVVIR